MFCPDCGTEVAEGRKFCGKCGAAVGVGAVRNATVAVGDPAAPVSAQQPTQPASPQQKLVYALVALLVVLGGFAWWWLHRPAPAYKVEDPGIYPFQGLSADGKTEKWGFIDADGKVLIQPEWDAVALANVSRQNVAFSEGLCGVQKNGKWGYIDTGGNLVIANQFESAGPFVEGLARINLGNQIGYIDKTGRYVINPQFNQAGDFHEGLAAAHTEEGWGFIDKTGAFIIKPSFPSADAEGFSNGRAGVCPGTKSFLGMVAGKCGYIDHKGSFAVKPQFDSINTFSEGLAAVRIGNKWGYSDTAGKIVINPQFDQALAFSGGLAAVGVSGHFGTIDKQGGYVLNPGQYNIQAGDGDVQRVTSSDGTGLMTKDGKWIAKPSKALVGVGPIFGKVFFGIIPGNVVIPLSTSGKVLAGSYKGATLVSLAQDIEDESHALTALREIINAETSYSTLYPNIGFTADLKNLGPAAGTPDASHAGLIDDVLASGKKENYEFTVIIPAGTSTGGTNFNYMVVVKASSGNFGRTFCADSSQTIHHTSAGEECSMSSPD